MAEDLIEITDLNRPYWDALREGRLTFQRCPACAHAWLPARSECPHCLRADAAWENAAGSGRVISWVVYRTAYHDSVRDRVPYNVAVVELDEGPRLITNILGIDHAAIEAEMRVTMVTEPRGNLVVACFRPAAR